MKTTIRLLSGIVIGALLAGCATETYVSQENREKFSDVNVSKFLISECLAPQREIHIAVAEHFDFDKFKIREADATSLDAFIRDIQGLSGRITIAGHTDYKGSNEYNDALSLRRAQSVAAYLKQQLDPTFYDWEIKHFGETQPLTLDTSEQARAENRRAYVMFEEAQKYDEMPFCEPPKPGRKVYMAMTPHFDFDQSALKAEDLTQLDDFIEQLQGLEGSILVAGHTDQVGSLSYNEKLAERRAQTVVEYLKTKLDASRLVWEVKAFGELQPVINQTTSEANALNRRAFIVFKESEHGQLTE
ncbi:OmpA family protein [Vibrio parahaemolyticus]|uniref:OmpA family protein n=1 Tax=Vibrio parahaemolyticus TaxID=670 RepID=UPI0003FC78BC|nr:OmpA family protein [Vibrio parahaemolyticus]KZW07549.1 cell envelope biogenesis protein OmpA [Vibrio parahaemolyticus]KZW12510.1 cell envelope biogenesis protein OmpA [Vibrio parahaemolyticus]KZW15557.1 cell envelope biogenesis protein OmpA [Vibrio parahaemolyticus]KZW18190.1 cell envelope biogenesis protein OmpA [Vibrio parahaemolyticus]KZW20160.1 cell envelope biogenesis protein OmpA [Vibrio parahaemolyticus]